MSRAACLLFPIRWEEPFGLVVIEAMACGTPVAALRRGAVPELIVSGQTGVIVDRPEELPSAISAGRRLDPGRCRKHVEANFTTDGMAAGYEAGYWQTMAAAASPGIMLRESRATALRSAAGAAADAAAAGRGGRR